MFEAVIMEQTEFAFEYSQQSKESFSLDLWKQFEENAKQLSDTIQSFSLEQLELSL